MFSLSCHPSTSPRLLPVHRRNSPPLLSDLRARPLYIGNWSAVWVLPMADPFRPSPHSSPARSFLAFTTRAAATTHSPLPQRSISHPSTPTPNQSHGRDFVRRPISSAEYQEKSPLRNAKIFEELVAILQESKTIVSFEWKGRKCQGKFVPVP